MRKIVSFLLKHKVYTLIGLAFLILGGYFSWQKLFTTTETVRYVTAKVAKGNLITSVSGTGQIAATNQFDIKAKASGDIIYLNATVGQEVKSGQVLARINASDVYKNLRDAQANLESAKISLEKIKQPATDLEILQAENSLTQAQETKQDYEKDLIKNYDDGFNNVSNAFLDLPGVIQGLYDILYGNSFSTQQDNSSAYVDMVKQYDEKVIGLAADAKIKYTLARQAYDAAFDEYKSTSRDADKLTIEKLIAQTYSTTKTMADAVKSASNFLEFVQDQLKTQGESIPALLTTHKSSLSGYTSKTNSHLTSLLSSQTSIQSAKDSIVSANRTIAEKTANLKDLKAGTNALDLASAELSYKQKQNALTDVQETLADYTIKAPADGIIAAVEIKKGDSVSSGATAVTVITKQKVATISLNEVDAAKVKVGQKVTLTFDAIEDLEISGEVGEVDTLGTVTSGVVSYDVKIIFDVQDDRIKSGMTVTATIITSAKQDVLIIKSSAIKTQNSSNYVEVLQNGSPQKTTVTIGDSNDTMTEITGGLTENQEVITQTITATAASVKSTTSTSKTNTNSNNRGGGMMIPGM